MPAHPTTVDLAIVGAGAAGLMAAIQAGRRRPGLSIVLLDSARRPGAKILVSGGGRCNVTHDTVDATAFAGSPRPAIRKVLSRFDVAHTVAFFAEIGVRLKREETGKLFPVGDSARTVLDALLRAARAGGAVLRHPCRVESIRREAGRFLVAGPASGPACWEGLSARRLVLATGGRSLPKSGSDGHGYHLARSLGHTLTERIIPALVPLTLESGCFVRGLSGLSQEVVLEVLGPTGRKIASSGGPMLCTHFGISGPAALDISRYFIDAAQDDPGARLRVDWLGRTPREEADRMLRDPGRRTIPGRLRDRMPERLARAILPPCRRRPVHPGAPAEPRVPPDAGRGPDRDDAAGHRPSRLHSRRGDRGGRAAVRDQAGDDGVACRSRSEPLRRDPGRRWPDRRIQLPVGVGQRIHCRRGGGGEKRWMTSGT